jgi:hypothetical protein
MDRSHARATIDAALWLLVALASAAGFVILMLLLTSRPAAALDVPSVGAVAQDPVGTLTKTVADVAAAEPAGQPAAPSPKAAAPVAPVTAAVTPVLDRVVAPVTTVVEDVVKPATQRVVTPVLGIVEDVTPPIAGALEPVTGTIDAVVTPAARHVVTPVTGIVDDLISPSPDATVLPDLGGAVRRLTAPTAAPLPLTSDASRRTEPPASPIPATGTEQFGSAIGAAEVTRAPGARTATTPPAPRDRAPFDMPADAPAPPLAPAGPSSPADGATRAPTLLVNFAIVLAVVALALVASRLVALYQRLPRTQFLTVLIERPG